MELKPRARIALLESHVLRMEPPPLALTQRSPASVTQLAKPKTLAISARAPLWTAPHAQASSMTRVILAQHALRTRLAM
jgi:hypothetical protein